MAALYVGGLPNQDIKLSPKSNAITMGRSHLSGYLRSTSQRAERKRKMMQQVRSRGDVGALSPAALESAVLCDRISAFGQGIGAVLRGLCAAPGRLLRAVDDAHRLRALAQLDDRRLSALGLTRADLPGMVYGWQDVGTPAVQLCRREPLEWKPEPQHRKAA